MVGVDRPWCSPTKSGYCISQIALPFSPALRPESAIHIGGCSIVVRRGTPAVRWRGFCVHGWNSWAGLGGWVGLGWGEERERGRERQGKEERETRKEGEGVQPWHCVRDTACTDRVLFRRSFTMSGGQSIAFFPSTLPFGTSAQPFTPSSNACSGAKSRSIMERACPSLPVLERSHTCQGSFSSQYCAGRIFRKNVNTRIARPKEPLERHLRTQQHHRE